MSAKSLSVSHLALPLLLAGSLAAAAVPVKNADPTSAAWRLSGPYSHENLTVYLIHGPDQIKSKNILTLDRALQQKLAVVHETQNVNELQVENLSPTQEVFIQAGDIVKGGQQDRTLAHDMIIPPRSGKVALPCFCVEAGRWTRRGGEDVRQFSQSATNLPLNAQKLAARKAKDQGQVWASVAGAQNALARRSGGAGEVRSPASPTSLQLTLESKGVTERIDGYVKQLEHCGDHDADVIGYAVCINGKVNNADVYASHELFVQLWPKLLKASAVEAVANLQKSKKFDAPTADAVRGFLADAARGKKTEREINKRLKETMYETIDTCSFESKEEGRAPLRRSYIKK